MFKKIINKIIDKKMENLGYKKVVDNKIIVEYERFNKICKYKEGVSVGKNARIFSCDLSTKLYNDKGENLLFNTANAVDIEVAQLLIKRYKNTFRK